jgi:hypothetical protein
MSDSLIDNLQSLTASEAGQPLKATRKRPFACDLSALHYLKHLLSPASSFE